uniref:Trafficking protein particle complex subunit n=1 Tax=Leptocylindrus danicus TaxID=163516 RepID=A0A7S2KF60_9STRA|mmetsp:Transcript_22202/g.33322  ORF Transcript_22202/g.33322 Transcript_22202/m.33322 type:complete len:177 (+) Transcript_22202:34-564(+)
MAVYSFHIFDRKGKTLFTKRYNTQNQIKQRPEEEEEQRKLIFGSLFSLREIVTTLSPMNDGFSEPTVLQSIKTGACTLHVYETMSGMRLVMYTDNYVANSGGDSPVREALKHIYSDIWVEYVVRSPLYRPGDLMPVSGNGSNAAVKATDGRNKFDIRSTEFEKRLDTFLTKKSWFR